MTEHERRHNRVLVHGPLKQWRGDQDILQGYMLCSNKDKKSGLPYVD